MVQAQVLTMPLHEDELGAAMLEYGFLIGLIALVAALGVTAFGVAVSAIFDDPALLALLSS